MMNKININTYLPKASDNFFFDNNIWMYLYCPLGSYNSKIVQDYSNFFEKILNVGAKLYVSSLVLSEFYNSYSRLEFNIWKVGKGEKDYKKDFKPTDKFKETSKLINMSIESRILGVAKRINDEFINMSIEDISLRCENLDFNDSYYVELAKKYNCKIVTNDRDFFTISDNIEIATSL